MAVVWFCPSVVCDAYGPHRPQYETASFGVAPVCGLCGVDLEWRPA